MKMSTARKTCWNTSAIKLTDESARAKSDFPQSRPLSKNLEQFDCSRSFLFCPLPRRRVSLRRAPFCAFCILLAIFPLKLCAKLLLDIFPYLWYNIIVVKRKWTVKSRKMCVVRKGKPKQNKSWEISQNLLTNCHFCGIIIVSRGEHKTERQETVESTETALLIERSTVAIRVKKPQKQIGWVRW